MRQFSVVVVLGLLSIVGCSATDEENPETVTVCYALQCVDAGSNVDASSDVAATDSGLSTADAGTDTGVDLGARPTLMASEANEADVLYGWVAAGQPSATRVEEIVATGATIISLRLMSEDTFDEPGLIEGLGGTFIRYPTMASDYDNVAFREAMYDLYDAQLDAGVIVYLHCASSNRVGASWALYQAERKGVPPEDAIAMGKAAGLASLESTVRTVLGI